MARFQVNFHLYAENLDRAISFYTQFFKFSLLGKIEEADADPWAALKTENAIIWLGKEGTSTGLILLIDKDMERFVNQLGDKGVIFFLPEKFKNKSLENSKILKTEWGTHAWFNDSEGNVVMLFQPIEP